MVSMRSTLTLKVAGRGTRAENASACFCSVRWWAYGATATRSRAPCRRQIAELQKLLLVLNPGDAP